MAHDVEFVEQDRRLRGMLASERSSPPNQIGRRRMRSLTTMR
jgi:hypothetical protein